VGCPRGKVRLVTLWRAKKLTKLWVGQLPSTSRERRCRKDKRASKVDHCAAVSGVFVKVRRVIGELHKVVIVKGKTIGEKKTDDAISRTSGLLSQDEVALVK